MVNVPRATRHYSSVMPSAIQPAITTITIAKVLTGPLKAGEEYLAKRYRAVLGAWRVVELNEDIAESAARIRGAYGLKLPDAIQAASALAINADALVTHDRDFSKLRRIKVLTKASFNP
jgi:predicted nucleic acid-binding protein